MSSLRIIRPSSFLYHSPSAPLQPTFSSIILLRISSFPPIASVKTLAFTSPLRLNYATPLQSVIGSGIKTLTPFSSSCTSTMTSKIVEHVVLFNVKETAEQSQIDTMMSRLNGLISLDGVLHLTAGKITRFRANSSLEFTHFLHSRYKTKQDLSHYSAHPSHLSVVKESVLPNSADIMSIDWVSDLAEPVVPTPGMAARLMLLKPKEGFGENQLEAISSKIKASVPSIKQISYGENFSPSRAKGFQLGFLSFFPGIDQIDAMEVTAEAAELQSGNLMEDVIVVDFSIASPASSL